MKTGTNLYRDGSDICNNEKHESVKLNEKDINRVTEIEMSLTKRTRREREALGGRAKLFFTLFSIQTSTISLREREREREQTLKNMKEVRFLF